MELAYDLMGSQKPAIVLLHGYGLNRSIWQELASNHLYDQQVLMLDMRGHGESDVTSGPYLMALLAEDLAQLLEFLGLSNAIVCGHSMGGYAALAFAEGYPDKLAGLGLITTNARADSEEKRGGRYALINQIKEQGSIAVAESLAPRLSRDPAVIRLSHDMICQTDPAGLIGAAEGMAERPDRMRLLAAIHVPALVVAGEADQITNLADAKLMADYLPHSTFLQISNAGHMPMLETADELGRGLWSLVEGVQATFL